ncbi:DNA cytosine methyltransferase [Streptomyces sp. NPDC051636]|uniref:DNA cytosine methyltransferase n=1 Tax=Streptomyces sp. NPDC051636 TaxID=3365663 RepID=UPI0037A5555C
MTITFTDIFCGAGGASTGLVNAGWELKLAANHWQTAIDTHSANHPQAEHVCADVSNYDMRRLPRTDVLWASPICTEISPAGGRRRSKKVSGLTEEELRSLPDAAFERTRATAYDVIRAVEVHRYKAVLIENVTEFATDWILFDWWLSGMVKLGYNYQIVCVSSAHVGDELNPAAPQWRDRLYIVFTRVGMRLPDVAPRPLARCEECDEDVYARQTWRPGHTETRIGKYGQQYDYTCPNHDTAVIVEPYVRPASDIIDWTNLGTRIGDRKRPLAPTTMGRIAAGLEMFPDDPSIVTVNHGGHDGRAFRPDLTPLPSRTVKIGEGLVVPPGAFPHATTADLAAPPFIVEFRNHATAERVDRPLATVTAGGNHHGLVIPFRKGSVPKRTSEPLHTLSTRDSAGLLRPAVKIEDCHFRMLQWREQMSAQRFPETYIVKGRSKAEKTMQAGNAVSCNVPQWLGHAVSAVM